MSATLRMGKKKTQPDGGGEKKRGLTFRLDDEELAFKLRLVVEAKGVSAAKYLKPLIVEQIEADFLLLNDRIQVLIQKGKGK